MISDFVFCVVAIGRLASGCKPTNIVLHTNAFNFGSLTNSNVSHSEIEVLSVVNYIERVSEEKHVFLSSVVFNNSKAHNK